MVIRDIEEVDTGPERHKVHIAMSRLFGDLVTLVKTKTGERVEGLRASVQRNRVYIMDSENRSLKYNIEVGDRIQREVRGVPEIFRVTEPNYVSGISGRLAGYQSYVSRVDDIAAAEHDIASPQPDSRIIILCMASDPKDEARLRLGEEFRSIRERLEHSRHRERIVLEERHAVRTTDFTQAIIDTSPNIIHFAGHGSSVGELCLEDVTGNSKPVPPSSLDRLFSALPDSVHCVVINACHSEDQAKSISKHVPHVIGMSAELSDEAAIAFSVGFYMAVVNGDPYVKAFNLGVAQVAMESPGEEDVPKHHMNQQLQSRIPKRPLQNRAERRTIGTTSQRHQDFASSTIKSFSFDPMNNVLEVEFHFGGTYEYANVPEAVYRRLLDASSKGSFHAQFIKECYPYARK